MAGVVFSLHPHKSPQGYQVDGVNRLAFADAQEPGREAKAELVDLYAEHFGCEEVAGLVDHHYYRQQCQEE